MSNESLNQTQFGLEKPLFEQPVALPVEPKPAPDPSVPPKKKNKVVLIVGLLAIVVVALVLILIILMRGKEAVGPSFEDKTQTQRQEYGPLQNRLNEIKEELDAADPRQEELPFPPINNDIMVEPLAK